MIIGKYNVSSTRGKSAALHVARVRSLNSKALLAEVFPGVMDPDRKGHTDPYGFIVRNPASNSYKSFVKQLQERGVSEDDIRLLLQIDYK